MFLSIEKDNWDPYQDGATVDGKYYGYGLVFLAAVDQRSFLALAVKYIHVGTITLEDLVGAVDIPQEKSQRTGNQLQYLMLQIAQLVIKALILGIYSGRSIFR